VRAQEAMQVLLRRGREKHQEEQGEASGEAGRSIRRSSNL